MFLKFVYIVFVGIIVAAFIGVGIEAFYPEPKGPEPPLSVKYTQNVQISDMTALAQIRQEQQQYEDAFKQFQIIDSQYNRNVSIISLVLAVLVLTVSLTLLKQITVMADGSMLGGVLTLAYSIVRGFGTDDNRFRFVMMSISLIVTLTLGYLKFIKPLPEK